MRTAPTDLDEIQLAKALSGGWRLSVESLTYVALGGGSHHWLLRAQDGNQYFVTVDDLDTKPWLGSHRDAAYAGLRSALVTARALHDAGLEFVVATISAVDGDVVHRLDSRYSVAVFPFIPGQAGEFGAAVNQAERAEMCGLWAKLHLATAVVGHEAPSRGFDLPGRIALDRAMTQLDRTWAGGPFSEPTREWLLANRQIVREALSAFDALARDIAAAGSEPVITHGEPHAGNLIRAAGALFLVDWDAVGLAPPERDLWMLDDGTKDGLKPYSDATRRTLSRAALDFYRLAWALADIAAFVATLRKPHTRHADTEKAWRAMKDSGSALRTMFPD